MWLTAKQAVHSKEVRKKMNIIHVIISYIIYVTYLHIYIAQLFSCPYPYSKERVQREIRGTIIGQSIPCILEPQRVELGI